MKAELTIILSVATILLAAAVILYDIARIRFDVCNPKYTFLCYYCVVMAVYPIYIFSLDKPTLFIGNKTDRDLTYWLQASVLTFVSLIAFVAGCAVRNPRAETKAVGILAPFEMQAGRAFSAFMLCIATASYFTYKTFFTGGIGQYYESFVSTRYGLGTARYMGYFATTFYAIISILLIGLMISRRWHNKHGVRMAFALFGVAIVSSLLTGFRIVAIPLILTALYYRHYYLEALTVRKTAVLALVVIIGLAAYGAVRREVEANLSSETIERASLSESINVLFTRLKGLEVLATVMSSAGSEHIERSYFVDGAYEAATILLPRELFSAKPEPQSSVFGKVFFQDYLFYRDGVVSDNTGGIAPSIVAYLYWQVGPLPAIVVMFLLGTFFSFVYRVFVRGINAPIIAVFYLALAPLLIRYAEAPQDAVNAQVTNLGIVALGLLLVGVVRRRSLPPRVATSVAPGGGIGSPRCLSNVRRW